MKSRTVPSRRIDHPVKVRREIWVDPDVLESAQRHLGAATEAETVELALDLVISGVQPKRRSHRRSKLRSVAEGGAD